MATKTTTARKKVAAKRPHFSVRAIRNANPRGFRSHKAGGVFARIFSL